MGIDFAKKAYVDAWFRHPVLGDPSFDNFQKLGDTVHRGQPPFEWPVNGSLFRDPKSGFWYYYASLYPRGYWNPRGELSHFLIYRSEDKGQSWNFLGRCFPDDTCPFVGLEDLAMSAPDAVVFYDPVEEKYWLTYDWGIGRKVFDAQGSWHWEILEDAGVALAWSEKPEGPFHKLKTWVHNNKFPSSRVGIFNRGYSSSTIRRKEDWIRFIQQDSGPCFGWGLTCRTANSPEGPWSDPILLLSPERGEFYPALMEYCFCLERDGVVYAPATSVAADRNYQMVYAADLEKAHDPAAWRCVQEGSLWHARPLEDEKFGIWGQTLHGFWQDGRYYTMYAAKDARDCGMLSVANCPMEEVFADGFTISGHLSKAISPILAAYRDFRLRMELELIGTAEVLLKYCGILGPEQCTSNAVSAKECFLDCLSLELREDGAFRVLIHTRTEDQVLGTGAAGEKIAAVDVGIFGERMAVSVNGKLCWEGNVPEKHTVPLAVCAHEESILRCSKFEIEGDPERYCLRHSARDAVLTAMHSLSWQPAEQLTFITEKGYIGQADHWVKWNFRGDGFRLYAPKGPELGQAEIWVDGNLCATVDLYAQKEEHSKAVFEATNLPGENRHAVVLKGCEGHCFAADLLEAFGMPYGKTNI